MKDYSILGFVLGYPYLRQLPSRVSLYPPFGYDVCQEESDLTGFNLLKI